ncbi:MAG: tetratricopeptide repeat protein [Pseudomonadota bacterium]
MSLLQELKRRNVYRVGIGYLATSWVALQMADVVVENLDMPAWAFKALLALIVIGFPVALGLAWAFEFTSDGVKRDTSDASAKVSSPATAGQYIQLAVIAILAVAVGYLVIDKFKSEADPQSVAAESVERSIVVLPFQNITAVEDDTFFVDGMHDYLLTQLARLGTLEKVIARPTAETYRETNKPLREIAEELGVATVLTGGFQRAGDNVRINMQLIRAETGQPLWANTWDRRLTLENLFDTQTSISREVVAALQGALSEQDRDQLARQPTTNTEAFEQYSLGRTLLARRTAPNIRAALENFERAVELDPDFVLAWVGVADANALLTNYSDVQDEASFPLRRRAIDRALFLNPESGEALTALADLRRDQGDDEAAESFFLQAIQRAPHYPTARHWYSLLLGNIGRIEEAIEQIRIARDIDPQAAILATAEASFLLTVGDYDAADRVMLDGIRRNPDFHNLYGSRAELFVLRGRIDEALRWQTEGARLAPTSPEARETECELQAVLGMLDEAQACAARLFQDFPQSMIPGMSEIDLVISVQRDKMDEFLVPAEQLKDMPKGLKIGMGQAHFLGNNMEDARVLLESTRPDLFDLATDTIAPGDITTTLIIAGIFAAEGDEEKAEQLLAAVETSRAELPYVSTGGEFSPTIAALGAEDFEAAARTLSDPLIRSLWWVFVSPVFEQDRKNPTFAAAVESLRTEIDKQRAAYIASPDLGPL